MKPYRRNGSTESLPETIERIEARIKRLQDDLKNLHHGKQNPENGFARFLKTIDRRQN